MKSKKQMEEEAKNWKVIAIFLGMVLLGAVINLILTDRNLNNCETELEGYGLCGCYCSNHSTFIDDELIRTELVCEQSYPRDRFVWENDALNEVSE